MVRAPELPPPPALPVRSPPVAIAGEVETAIAGRNGGPAIEARVHAPPGAKRAIVFCHPHPLYGGSMHSPVPLAIVKYVSELARDRIAWARFNFRGVGASEGTFDRGVGEVDDALAVLESLRRAAPGAPLTVCGHSFGAWVGIRAAVQDGHVERALLIAPSARYFWSAEASRRPPFRTAIFVGDLDEFCDVDDARTLASDLGAELRIFEGFDHHFLKSRRALAEATLPFVAPEAPLL
jgi:alpha/beta superfamily hydrolase